MTNPYEAPRSELADPAPEVKVAGGKLPPRLQLVLLTAAVVFAFSSIRMVGGISALIYAWTSFPQVPMSARIYVQIALSVTLVAASFFAFVRVLRASSAVQHDVAAAYLALLIGVVTWQLVSWWLSGAGDIERVQQGPNALRWTKVWFALRVCWPAALLLLVAPHSRFRMKRGPFP